MSQSKCDASVCCADLKWKLRYVFFLLKENDKSFHDVSDIVFS